MGLLSVPSTMFIHRRVCLLEQAIVRVSGSWQSRREWRARIKSSSPITRRRALWLALNIHTERKRWLNSFSELESSQWMAIGPTCEAGLCGVHPIGEGATQMRWRLLKLVAGVTAQLFCNITSLTSRRLCQLCHRVSSWTEDFRLIRLATDSYSLGVTVKNLRSSYLIHWTREASHLMLLSTEDSVPVVTLRCNICKRWLQLNHLQTDPTLSDCIQTDRFPQRNIKTKHTFCFCTISYLIGSSLS